MKSKIKLWSIILGFSVIIGIIAGIFSIDDRYAKGDDLKNYATGTELKMLDAKAAKSLDEFNTKQTVQFKALEINMNSQYLMLRNQWITDKVSQLRERLVKDPNNKILQIEYKELLSEQQRTKDALDKTFK